MHEEDLGDAQGHMVMMGGTIIVLIIALIFGAIASVYV
jgi:hypothetical protein